MAAFPTCRTPGAWGPALAALLLSACAGDSRGGPKAEPALTPLTHQEREQLEQTGKKADQYFPLYVDSLNRFASADPNEWDLGEQGLAHIETLYRRPVETELRARLRAADPKTRDEARRALARRGRMLALWMDLKPTEKEEAAMKEMAKFGRSSDGRTYEDLRRDIYARWIRTREQMLALGDDAADLLIDTYLRMLPLAAAEEQMVLRDELEQCGPKRVIPILTAILDLPARAEGGDAQLKLQAMLVLVRFIDREDVRDAIQKYAHTPDLTVRRQLPLALRDAYKGRSDDAPRALLEPMLRGDPAWQVQAAAAQALGEIGNPRACPALLDVLDHSALEKEEDRASVAKFVVAALGKLHCPDAVEPLVRVLERQEKLEPAARDAQLTRNATQALSRITGQYFATAFGWRAWLEQHPGSR